MAILESDTKSERGALERQEPLADSPRPLAPGLLSGTHLATEWVNDRFRRPKHLLVRSPESASKRPAGHESNLRFRHSPASGLRFCRGWETVRAQRAFRIASQVST